STGNRPAGGVENGAAAQLCSSHIGYHPVLRAFALSASGGRMRAHAPSPSALVGRDRELATLRERLAAALAGTGGLTLIGGEAGIGKTALAEALCRDAAAQGARILV